MVTAMVTVMVMVMVMMMMMTTTANNNSKRCFLITIVVRIVRAANTNSTW